MGTIENGKSRAAEYLMTRLADTKLSSLELKETLEYLCSVMIHRWNRLGVVERDLVKRKVHFTAPNKEVVEKVVKKIKSL